MSTASTYARDPRRAILVNGDAYRRNLNKRPEPDITLTQSLIAGVVVAVWALGVLAIAVGVS
jgi:hypothetical protein